MIYDQYYYIAALVTYKTIVKNKQAIKTSLAFSNKTFYCSVFLKFEILWCPDKTPQGKMAQPFIGGYVSHPFVRAGLTFALAEPIWQGHFVMGHCVRAILFWAIVSGLFCSPSFCLVTDKNHIVIFTGELLQILPLINMNLT